MDMTQAAVFLAGAILTMLGFIIIIIGIVIVNNIIHRYWKPIKVLRFEDYPPSKTIYENNAPTKIEPEIKEKK